MTPTETVRAYLESSSPGAIDFDRLRGLLTDDFTLTDPMVAATSADDFVAKLRQFGNQPGLENTIEEIVGHGNRVAALTRLRAHTETITYCMWFTVCDEKVSDVLVVYDPRPFLRMAQSS